MNGLKDTLKNAYQKDLISRIEYQQVQELLDSDDPQDQERAIQFFEELDAKLDTFIQLQQKKQKKQAKNALTDVKRLNLN